MPYKTRAQKQFEIVWERGRINGREEGERQGNRDGYRQGLLDFAWAISNHLQDEAERYTLGSQTQRAQASLAAMHPLLILPRLDLTFDSDNGRSYGREEGRALGYPHGYTRALSDMMRALLTDAPHTGSARLEQAVNAAVCSLYHQLPDR